MNNSLDWFEFFKLFGAPIATVVAASATAIVALSAALITGIISYKQWQIAKYQADIAVDKLKYETFERRRDVYAATREIIILVTPRPPAGQEPTTEINNCLDRMDECKFFFKETISNRVNSIGRAASELNIAYIKLNIMSHSHPAYAETQADINHLRAELSVERRSLAEIFEKDLAFHFLISSPDVNDPRHLIRLSGWTYAPIALAAIGSLAIIAFVALKIL